MTKLSRGSLSDRRFVLAAGLVATLPVFASTVSAVLSGWTPVFDDGIIAARAFDVLTVHSPLVGTFSDASVPGVGGVYSPGPLLYWVLAVQAHFLGAWALPVTMGLVNAAAVVGAVILGRRRGGTGLMILTAMAAVLVCRSLPQAMLHEIDNSRAGLMVFMLLLFVSWSVACGEYRLLPLMVLLASFAVQVHFALAPAALVAFVVGVAGLVWPRAAQGTDGGGRTRVSRGWWLGAAIVGLLCWSGPVVDQLVHSPGNLRRIVQTAVAHKTTAGFGTGWNALVSAVGAWPRWLRPYAPGAEIRDLLAPGSLSVITALLLVAGLIIVNVRGLRRGRREVVAGTTLALALSATIVVVAASLPVTLTLRDYAMRWSSPVGMFAWVILGWSLFGTRSTRAAPPPVQARFSIPSPVMAVVALVAIGGLGVVAATGIAADSDTMRWAFSPARAAAADISSRLGSPGAVLVRSSSFSAYSFQTAVIYDLRRDGYRVVAPNDGLQFLLADRLGSYYAEGSLSRARRRSEAVLVVDVTRGRVARPRVLARAGLTDAPAFLGGLVPTELTVSVQSSAATPVPGR